MMKIIFLSVFIIGLISSHFSVLSSIKAKGNVIFTVKIPADNHGDVEVQNIINEFKRKLKIIFYVFLALSLIILLIGKWISISIIYMDLYLLGIMISYHLHFDIYRRKLLEVKNKRKWGVGEKRIISIDTELSRLKDTFPVSAKWFLPVIFIIMISMLFMYKKVEGDKELYVPIFATIVLILGINMIVYYVFRKTGNIVYTEKSEINIALNKVFKREWTRAIVIAAYGDLLLIPMMFTIINFDIKYILLLGALSGMLLLNSIPMIYAYCKINGARRKLLSLEGEDLTVDNDEYWRFGMYINPDDSKVLIEKQIGPGLTINMATKAGKVFIACIVTAFVAIVCLGIIMIPVDFSDIKMSCQRGEIKIQAPIYEERIKMEDIRDIKLSSNFPRAVKVNGIGTDRLKLGTYNVKGYGKSKVYINNDVKTFIEIELRDGTYVIVNGIDTVETKAYYNLIKEKIEKI